MYSTAHLVCAVAVLSFVQTIAAFAITAPPHPHAARATCANTACAKASSASEAYASASPSAHNAIISAELAYYCLKSVPNHREPAVRYLNSLRSWLEFQSDLEYLNDPPEGYLFPKVNLHHDLDEIQKKVEEGFYESEYDMQLDLMAMVAAAHDGHFTLEPDLASQVFVFLRPDSELVSVSADGIELPQIYFAGDLLDVNADGSLIPATGYTPSPIQTIDGKDVVSFLLTQSLVGLPQDPDAAWNQNFFSLGRTLTSNWKNPLYYPGLSTRITFVNGTSIVLSNVAAVVGSLKGVSTGEDGYSAFCPYATVTDYNEAASNFYPNSTSTATPSTSTIPPPAPTIANFPYPAIKHSADSIAGYFLNDTGFTDVAVLQVRDFEASDSIHFDPSTWQHEFQQVLEKFLAAAVKLGKKKLIIDLQGNTGGFISSGTDFFTQLFPPIAPNSKGNMRATFGLGVAIDVASANISAAERTPDQTDEDVLENSFVPFAFQTVVTPDLKEFPDAKSYFGLIPRYGGNFTSFFQNNYTDPVFSDFRGTGITITGTNDRKGFKQPFQPANMVVLTDAFCASSCTVATESLKSYAGVQFITLGGRPQEGPMQAVGGVKGSQVFTFLNNIGTALDLFQSADQKILSQADGTLWQNFTYLPLLRSLGSGKVNGRNNFRVGDSTETPLQFVYEAADCRLWFTREMLYDPVFLWKRVAQVAFTDRKGTQFNSKYCVKNSTGHPTSISGGWKPGTLGPQSPPSNARSTIDGWTLNGSIVGPANTGGQSNSPALNSIKTACAGYTGSAWLVQVVCGALGRYG